MPAADWVGDRAFTLTLTHAHHPRDPRRPLHALQCGCPSLPPCCCSQSALKTLLLRTSCRNPLVLQPAGLSHSLGLTTPLARCHHCSSPLQRQHPYPSRSLPSTKPPLFQRPATLTPDRRPTTCTRAPSHARTSPLGPFLRAQPFLVPHHHHIVTTTPPTRLPVHSRTLDSTPQPGYRTNAARLRPARARGHGQRAQSESTNNRGTFGPAGTIGRPPNVDLH